MTNLRKYSLLILLGMAGGTIYDFPYIKYIFYNQLLSAMNINNTQLGVLTTIYGVGCLVLYIPGGFLADHISSKLSLTLSLIMTAILAIVFGLTLNFTISIVIWALLAFSSAFIFWSALIKAVRIVGGEKNGGRMYGIYYAANGLSAALLNFFSLWIYGQSNNSKSGMLLATFSMALVIGLIGILVFIFLPSEDEKTAERNTKVEFSQIKKILRSPVVWLISIIFFMTYSLFSGVSYLTPYLADVANISNQMSSFLGIIRNYVFLLLAPLSGLIADRVFHSTLKWFVIGYIVLAFSLLALVFLKNLPIGMVIFLSLIPGMLALSLYGIQFSIIAESKLPLKLMGLITGFVSLVGYLPDLILPTLYGKILDTNSVVEGYKKVFLFLTIFALVASLFSWVIYKVNRKKQVEIDNKK
ncbi:MFS transporter [Liquorilactobacillus ghanensis]|uniref:MFS transporter n=1 Tax=Liquorilactobacillus ghanensis TaxID=399370 RepID=UPI0039E9A02B